MNDTLVEVRGLKQHFLKKSGIFRPKVTRVQAVDGVSFAIQRKETFGLVGESGCGKSTTGRSILRLYEPTEGKILYEAKEITCLSKKDLFPYRRRMQMIFQDPYASLNPRLTVADTIGEAMAIHGIASGSEKQEKIESLLRLVGLNRSHALRYPHEFSGGQRQRVGIARALAVEPEFIVCDEPISALDVSIQAQIVNMLEELQERLGLTYLFIAHDLSMIKHISHRVGVMYLGNLVELSETEELYSNPIHPYTKALLSSMPIPDPDISESVQRIRLEGEIPSPINPPSGCKFRTRCVYAKKKCSEIIPELREVGPRHFVACHCI